MKYYIRIAFTALLYCQMKLFTIVWTEAHLSSALAEAKKYEDITIDELDYIFQYFKESNFTSKFFFKYQIKKLPSFVRHSAICIPRKKNSKNKYDIYLFAQDYPINRGSYGALFIGRKMNFQAPNDGKKIVIKFQNTLHKKADRNDWIKNYANHIKNEISYLKKFGYLRLVTEKKNDNFAHEFQDSSLVLVFDFIEGHHIYYLIDNGLIEDMRHFEKIKSTVFHELKKFHKKGFCHGDLHGQNFLIQLPKSPRDRIKVSIIDFGWTHEIKNGDAECIVEDKTRLEKAFARVRKCLEKNLLRRFIKPCKFSPF